MTMDEPGASQTKTCNQIVASILFGEAIRFDTARCLRIDHIGHLVSRLSFLGSLSPKLKLCV
jgi:hypothetical protein